MWPGYVDLHSILHYPRDTPFHTVQAAALLVRRGSASSPKASQMGQAANVLYHALPVCRTARFDHSVGYCGPGGPARCSTPKPHPASLAICVHPHLVASGNDCNQTLSPLTQSVSHGGSDVYGGIEPLRRLEKLLTRRGGSGREGPLGRDWQARDPREAQQSPDLLPPHGLPLAPPRSLQPPHDTNTTLGEERGGGL